MNSPWIQRYAERVNYQRALVPTWECIKNLHKAHLLAVPFEDLDIHLGKPLSLTPEDLYSKVVETNRGGFCYELNHLFGSMLREIGFKVTLIAAQVYGDDGQWGSYFDHMALLVEDQWLADVGFGGSSFLQPLRIHEINPQSDDGGVYQIKAIADQKYHLFRFHREYGDFKPLYRFDLKEQTIENFQNDCRLKQLDPNSHFVKNKICTIATIKGRDTLLNGVFTSKQGTDQLRIEVQNHEMESEILKRYFNIDLG